MRFINSQTDFVELETYLGKKSERPIYKPSSQWAKSSTRSTWKNTRLVRIDDDTIGVLYHHTVIVYYHRSGLMMLNTNGWHTISTKQRLNHFAPVYVYQRDYDWYFGNNNDYEDGLIINRFGQQVAQAYIHQMHESKIEGLSSTFFEHVLNSTDTTPMIDNGNGWIENRTILNVIVPQKSESESND